MNALSTIYGQVARLRRSWYERDPSRRRHLSRPVISVGNLVVGGAGKTPLVAALARVLLQAGHRPAILSRGYGRQPRVEGVVVVSDGSRVLVPATESGDEPQMLARRLPGVPVLVADDRYLAGRLAESRFDASVLLLDDGFQHLQLARTLDLLVVGAEDLAARVLPSGPLREPLAAARSADAVMVYGSDDEARRIAAELGVGAAFAVTPRYGPLTAIGTPLAHERPLAHKRRLARVEADLQHVEADLQVRLAIGNNTGRPDTGSVVAVAGIARPSRFFAALRACGVVVAREVTFRDHYWFTAADLERIAGIAKETGATRVVTTEKDAVRMESLPLDPELAWMMLPMDVSIEPADRFAEWLGRRI